MDALAGMRTGFAHPGWRKGGRVTVQQIRVAFHDAQGIEHGLRYRLDPDKHTQENILVSLGHGSFYESATSQVVLRLIGEGDRVIDVGAHVGYYTLLASRLVGSSGRVLAFEPNPETYPGLVANLLLNDVANVLALNCALGGEPGLADFFLNDDNEGESALWDVSSLYRSRDSKRRVSVAVTTLDQVALDCGWQACKLMKLDAEGYETRILRGGLKLFGQMRPRHVICEINRFALERCGTSELELRSVFEEMGYQTHLINLEGQDLCSGHLTRSLAHGEIVDTRYVFNLLFSLGAGDVFSNGDTE